MSFSEAEAHLGDPLPDHLEAVALRALRAVEGAPERVRRAAFLMGLFHDAGKATPWFQDYLHSKRGQSRRTRHSTLGAVLAHTLLAKAEEQGTISAWTHRAVLAGIARHHGNFESSIRQILDNVRESGKNRTAIHDQLEAFDQTGFKKWISRYLASEGLELELPSLDKKSVVNSISSLFFETGSPFENGGPFDDVTDGFDFLAAFGAFVGADKMHTAHPDWESEAPKVPTTAVDTYKQTAFGEPDNALDGRREQLFAELKQNLKSTEDEWVYTLTAPTGSGKTFMGLSAGLHLKNEIGGGSSGPLVYCLPFTSVIDQNSEEYEKVLTAADVPVDDRVLLKHHHLADPRYEDRNEGKIRDGADLLVETWESEIVVTTFYQFLHTLFTSENKNLKRFGALHDAVVVLDEVQAIDHDHWDDVRDMMKLCAERLGTTFVLMTATMPLLLQPGDGAQLLPEPGERFQYFTRTELAIDIDEPRSIEDLADDLVQAVEDDDQPKRRIVIVNRRQTAQDLFRAVQQVNVPTAMLSADLTPRHREQILDAYPDPDEGLDDGFLLVSTQVIEAGVDISSDEMIRELAPLDSVIQSAGRCNREFERDEPGRIRVVELEDDGDSLGVPPYSSFLVEQTKAVLEQFGSEGRIDEGVFHEMAQRYYERVRTRGSQASAVDKLADGDVHLLDDPDEGFQLIETRPKQSHFVMRNEEDRELWQEYIEIQNMEISNRRDLKNKRWRFQEIKREFSARIVNYPTDEQPTAEVIPVEPEESAYDPDVGLQRNLAAAGYEII